MTGLTIIAVGVSIPDAIASWKAAISSKYADNAIVSLHATLSMNVFVGFGTAWFISTVYAKIIGVDQYIFDGANSLLFMIAMFFVGYILTLFLLLIRRKFVGGELGGVRKITKFIY